MAFFEATGLLGTFQSIAVILISIRNCYKAKKKIPKLVSDGLSLLENINQATPQVSRFVELGGIGLEEFCIIAAKIMKIEADILNMRDLLVRRGKIYRLCSAPGTVSALESINSKLSQMETEIRLLACSVRSDMKVSVLLEAFEPVLDVVEEIIPQMDRLKEKKRLLANAREAFGTQGLASRMNRLVARSTESVYCFIMGKMFYEGMAVEVNYEKSANFFQCAISYGNEEAFAYLARQYSLGLGMKKDERKAVELYLNGAKLLDPKCLCEIRARKEIVVQSIFKIRFYLDS